MLAYSSASYNTALGYSGLYFIGDGEYSTAVGYHSGYYATGSYNTFVGANAGKGGQTSAPYSSGQYNTAIGKSFTSFNTAVNNTILGVDERLFSHNWWS